MVFTGGIHGSSGVNNIARSTACQIPGEKQLEHSSEKNARISSSQSFAADSVSLPRLDTLAGACPTNCLAECGHAPPECSKLGKTRIIAAANHGWLEIPYFLYRMLQLSFSGNRRTYTLCNIAYRQRGTVPVSSGGFFAGSYHMDL